MAEDNAQTNPDTQSQANAHTNAGQAETHPQKPADESGGRVVALCFYRTGQLYWFKSANLAVEPGEFVVADTEKGPDIGQVVYVKDRVEPGHPQPTKSLLRKAHRGDFRRDRQLRAKAQEALATCEKKIVEHGLQMKLVRAEYTLNGRHLTFFFTADDRVDFRDLVRDLAETFRCHIELRQIGVRDEAKMLDGLGPCGQPLCCARFLREFKPVGIRLAKDQDLPLNPEKISGVCDRLMCCLRYEHEGYATARAQLPQLGDEVQTPDGPGQVVGRHVLKQELTVHLDQERAVTFPAADVRPARRKENKTRKE